MACLISHLRTSGYVWGTSASVNGCCESSHVLWLDLDKRCIVHRRALCARKQQKKTCAGHILSSKSLLMLFFQHETLGTSAFFSTSSYKLLLLRVWMSTVNKTFRFLNICVLCPGFKILTSFIYVDHGSPTHTEQTLALAGTDDFFH